MTLVGAVLGPYPGLYWLDLENRRLVLRQDSPGVAAEVALDLKPEQQAQLIDALLPRPVAIEQTPEMEQALQERPQATRTPRSRPAGGYPGEIRAAEARRASRPLTIKCARCPALVPVASRGQIPRLCKACRNRPAFTVVRKAEAS